MSAYRCPDGRHRFAKFDDATVFCQRCGEQRVMDVTALMRALPPITYLPCSGPHYPTWPQQPWPGYFIWSAPGTTAFGLIDNMTVVS